MHHDSRTYIEFRHDGHTCDVVIVTFRDRGILPIEAKTWEYSINAPALSGDVHEELKALLNTLWLAVYHDK